MRRCLFRLRFRFRSGRNGALFPLLISAGLSHQETGCRPMEFVASFESSGLKIRTTISARTLISLRPQRVQVRHIDGRTNASKMRLQVLRRDHSRCRNCNQPGDEITLEVRPIRPGATTIEEMLTLCARCRSLVERWNSGGKAPLPVLLKSSSASGLKPGGQTKLCLGLGSSHQTPRTVA